ncbi:MAG TPA: hypothetical protein VK464_22175 [Symbiobacteriaceae bacterium]|jgi:hypothetical protein|nr:hypothetical protein [Symbiobacteriaceae bacterium]
MKRFWLLLAFGVLISGCAATPSTPAPAARKAENATPKQEAAAVGAPAFLRDLALRDLVAAGSGGRFIVQDQAKSLYLVSDAGKVHLGAAPEIGLVAAWGQNDFGYAFARKADDGSAYEIVGVGHEGSKVLAKAVGYPGAMQFIGQELHYIDAEGWKVVTWSGAPVLKAPLAFGPRANQPAWCAWLVTGPVCIGGYWDPVATEPPGLTVVRAGEPPRRVAPTGAYPVLGAGAVSRDGRLLAASLGARSAGAGNPGAVVVAWLDESGAPTRSKVFPLLVSELAFDAYGRLIAHVYPPDGSGPGSIVGLNLEDGSTAVLLDESAQGPYSVRMAPDQKWLYVLPVGGGFREIPLDPP